MDKGARPSTCLESRTKDTSSVGAERRRKTDRKEFIFLSMVIREKDLYLLVLVEISE